MKNFSKSILFGISLTLVNSGFTRATAEEPSKLVATKLFSTDKTKTVGTTLPKISKWPSLRPILFTPVITYTDSMEIVSLANCKVVTGTFQRCIIPTKTSNAPIFDSAVPLRSRVVSVITGDCKSSYQLAVNLEPNSGASVVFRYKEQQEAVLRGQDGDLIDSLRISDASELTEMSIFKGSCRIRLDIIMNELDVDSREQAEEIIAEYDNKISLKEAELQRLEELLLYSKAFGFLKELSEQFFNQLSYDAIQSLREASFAYSTDLINVVSGCKCILENPRDSESLCITISDEDRDNMLKVVFNLGELGNPEEWVNPDGSLKTMDEFFDDSEAQSIIATLEALGENGSVSKREEYTQLFNEAAVELEELKADRAMAVAQMGDFLN